jgi:hypothetical protein
MSRNFTSSRRRKLRCNGSRPTCDRCSSQGRLCHWPDTLIPGGYRTLPSQDPVNTNVQLPVEAQLASDSRPSSRFDDSLPPGLLDQLLSVFWQHHHVVDLCSCIHPTTFQKEMHEEKNRFLLHSILSLSALYITDGEAMTKSNTRFETAIALSNHYAVKARLESQRSSDQPTIPSIQANLCLGLRELIAWTDCKAWMYIGLAVRMAQAMRMRMEYNHRYCPRQREVRRRTFWACVILDRYVAYSTFRTQSIETALVTLHLPCTNVAFAFGHDKPGPAIEAIGKQTSGLDILPFFVKTLILWSDISAHYVNRGRRWAELPPHDPVSSYWKLEIAMKDWCATLPAELQWSPENLQAHRSLGQDIGYLEMHILIRHSLFMVHQEYLPQIEEPSSLEEGQNIPKTDRAGILFAHAEPSVLLICLEGAHKIREMLQTIQNDIPGHVKPRPSIIQGMAMVTAASVFLWAQYASEKTVPRDVLNIDIHDSRESFEYLVHILEGWGACWKIARSWCNSLKLLEILYRTVYANDTTSDMINDETENEDTENHEEQQSGAWLYRQREGDGLPDITMIPHGLYYKMRIITGLAAENSEMCKRLLRLAARKFRENNWLSEVLTFSDTVWMNDDTLPTDSEWWESNPLFAEDLPGRPPYA